MIVFLDRIIQCILFEAQSVVFEFNLSNSFIFDLFNKKSLCKKQTYNPKKMIIGGGVEHKTRYTYGTAGFRLQ